MEPRRVDSAPANDSSLQLAIVTMTWARDQAEARSLLRSLRILSKAGLPIYVGEGGSPAGFVEQLRRIPRVRVCVRPPGSKPTLVNQLQPAFARAQEEAVPDYVLYTEPDKQGFFRGELRRFIDAARPSGTVPAGLILAARTQRAFATFPSGQRIAEGFMNQVASEALGQMGDYTFGPALIHKRLLRFAHLAPDNLGWGWRFFLMAIARQLRMRIELCEVSAPCPRGQRMEDDEDARSYRLRQLVENVTGLANGWTCLLDQPLELAAPMVVAA